MKYVRYVAPDGQPPIESLFPQDLEDWFKGSRVTVDGAPTQRPLLVFRGTRVGLDDVTCPGEVYWATSSRMNAGFYQDGEIQNLYIRLINPLVLQDNGPGAAAVARAAMAEVNAGRASWDGVIFEDVVDGSHPSVVYAVFPVNGTIAERVRIVGRTRYEGEYGDPVYTGIQPPGDPMDFDRGDVIDADDPVVQRVCSSMHP